jgi:hypothetical protein
MVITDIWERKGVNGSANTVVGLQRIRWLGDHLGADEDDNVSIEHQIIIVKKV